MVKRMRFGQAACPVARALDVIGDWWSLLIIRDAFDGISRFSAFEANLGIAKGMLSTRLRDLIADGILQTVPAADGTAYKDYVLTEKGRGLFLVIVALRQWGEDFLYQPDEEKSDLLDKANGLPVERLNLRGQDGHVLQWHDTTVKKLSS